MIHSQPEMSRLLLEGGAEFGGQMSAADLRGMELAGGLDAPICILPTAAAADFNHKRAGQNGVYWFQSLGAKNVFTVDVIDSTSANDKSLAASIRTSRLIYLLGGFPRYTAETLAHSICWQAVLDAFAEGAVLAGSSAGAMILCEHYYDPYEKKVLRGLNVLSNACVLPHYNRFGQDWVDHLLRSLPKVMLIGIDEQTGMVRDGRDEWQVYGAGGVVLHRDGSTIRYERGGRFSFPGSGI